MGSNSRLPNSLAKGTTATKVYPVAYCIKRGASRPVVPLFQNGHWVCRCGVTNRSYLRKDALGTSIRHFGLHECLLYERDERCVCGQPVGDWHFPHLLSLPASGRYCDHDCRCRRDCRRPLSQSSGPPVVCCVLFHHTGFDGALSFFENRSGETRAEKATEKHRLFGLWELY